MCVDYRQLNNRNVKDSYVLPRIEEILDSLIYIDMKSEYHQVELEEGHKERNDFTVGPLVFTNLTVANWFIKCTSNLPEVGGGMFK